MIQNLYTKKDLLDALKQANKDNPDKKIGYTYMTLLKYEKAGLIIKPQNMVMVNGKPWRFYTKEEIQECVNRIVASK